MGRRLAERLQAGGEICRVVMPADGFGSIGTDTWQVNPGSAGDFDLLLQNLRNTAAPPTRTVFLWALDHAVDSTSAAADLDALETASVASVVHLIQALGRADLAAPLRIVTRNAQPVSTAASDGPAVNPAHAPLWGLGRVIGVEHPDLWDGLIDIDDAPADAVVDSLVEELHHTDEEDQVALRQGLRLVARLERVDAPDAAVLPIRPDGAYVVTGGLGLIGVEVARWLAASGARHLTLIGRTGVPDRALWPSLLKDSEAYRRVCAIEAIEALGATVEVASLDVSNEDQLRAYFDRFGRIAPPLRGVVHGASDSGSVRLLELDRDRLAAMLRPKVAGGWALHRVTESSALDFFVLFSSVAAVFGSLEMAHYAAANSFLDGLAHYRRSLGLPAVSVNWGAWEGMRETADRRRLFASSGMRFMPVARALTAFERVRSSDRAQLMVADVDWPVFKAVYEARRRRPFLDSIEADTAEATATPPGESIVQRLARTNLEERWGVLSAQIRAEVAAVLALPAAEVDIRKGLFDLGMDSLMSVELKTRLEALVGQSLPTTLTFKYPSVAALTDFLAVRLGVVMADGEAGTRSDTPGAAPGDELSEDDLATLLLERLEQIR
jgi:NAD(P)-dependent dehydrogenase (short-subunit alcohol dehydrogenase family)